MEDQRKFNYVVILIVIRLITSIIIMIINYLVSSWIEEKISLEKSLVFNLFIVSLIFETLGIVILALSIVMIYQHEGIRNYYKYLIIISLSIDVGLTIYYFVRFFAISCFAPGITLIHFIFTLISFLLIGLLVIKNFSTPESKISNKNRKDR